MATVERLKEDDVVALLGPIGRWPRGQQGTVVDELGTDKLVEISDEQGQMLDLIRVPASHLRRVEPSA